LGVSEQTIVSFQCCFVCGDILGKGFSSELGFTDGFLEFVELLLVCVVTVFDSVVRLSHPVDTESECLNCDECVSLDVDTVSELIGKEEVVAVRFLEEGDLFDFICSSFQALGWKHACTNGEGILSGKLCSGCRCLRRCLCCCFCCRLCCRFLCRELIFTVIVPFLFVAVVLAQFVLDTIGILAVVKSSPPLTGLGFTLVVVVLLHFTVLVAGQHLGFVVSSFSFKFDSCNSGR